MNWWALVVAGVPTLIGLLGVIAEQTPFEWDNIAVNWIRRIWSWVPVGEMNPEKMGK